MIEMIEEKKKHYWLKRAKNTITKYLKQDVQKKYTFPNVEYNTALIIMT